MEIKNPKTMRVFPWKWILIIVITAALIGALYFALRERLSLSEPKLCKSLLRVKVNPHKNPKDMSIYVAGSMFTTGQRFENAMITKALNDKGYTNVFLPQSSGIDDIIGLPAFLAGSPPFDKLDPNTRTVWSNYIWPLIYCLDLYDLVRADAVVFNANGQSPDPGGLNEVGLGAAMGKITILFYTEYDKTLNPMTVGVTGNVSIASAASFEEVPQQLTKMIAYRKKSGSYSYDLSPNLRNYATLGCLITNWKEKAMKSSWTQKTAFTRLIELAKKKTAGKLLMQSLTFNPTTVAPSFKVDNVQVTRHGVTGNEFTSQFRPST